MIGAQTRIQGQIPRLNTWIGAAVLVVAVSLLRVAVGDSLNAPPPALSSVQWQPAAAGLSPPAEALWRAGVPTGGSVAWVRAHFLLRPEQVEVASSAIVLSGPFSANIWVNDVAIAGKGVAAQRRNDELAGAIDASIPLGDAARTGVNQVTMLVSAHRMPLGLKGALHRLNLGAVGGSPRRPLSHYSIALAQTGLVLVLATTFLVAARRSRDVALLWAGIAAAALAIALAAETTRVWWNYSYPVHLPRQMSVWAALSLFGVGVLVAASHRWGDGRSLRWIGASLAAGAITLAFTGSVGISASGQLALIGAIAAFIAWKRADDGDIGARHFVLSQIALAILALRGGAFLDNDVYVAGALAIGAFAWKRVAPSTMPQAPAEGDESKTLLIKAEGNYSQITTVDGIRKLVRTNLSALTGGVLMRVHRSYVVNIRFARKLVARTGSRYELELHDGSWIPVSRRLASEVRARLDDSN